MKTIVIPCLLEVFIWLFCCLYLLGLADKLAGDDGNIYTFSDGTWEQYVPLDICMRFCPEFITGPAQLQARECFCKVKFDFQALFPSRS